MRYTQAEAIAIQARLDASKKKPKSEFAPDAGPEVGSGGIQDQIEQFLKSHMPHCWWDCKRYDVRTTSRPGVPDFVGVFYGVAFAIEVKRKGKKPTPEQLGELMWFELAGGRKIVAYSKDEAVAFLEGLRK